MKIELFMMENFFVIRRMINTFNELSWIAEVEPEKNICALDYDSFIIENEIDGLYYIACICWK